MSTRSLPNNPSLDHLRGQARTLQRAVRAGDPKALALIVELHPRANAEQNPVDPVALALADAQLVIARGYGFASWPRLRAHLDVVEGYSRRMDPVEPSGDEPADLPALVDRFLSLGSLGYTRDRAEHRAGARELLDAHPELGAATIHTAAATGDVEAVRRLLAADAALAIARGGPYDWDPLTYLAFSRIAPDAPGRSGVEVARLLIAAGADPNTGYLWQGMPSPFTALTGAFGGGEQGQPPHPESQALARVLLEAGADPNDNQTLYNRMFAPANDHLELLFDFGLGTETNGPWHRLLGDALPSPTAMVQEQLRWAADHGLVERVRLLLAHGVDPDGLGYHPLYGRRTPYELAAMAGNAEIAALLAVAGATVIEFDAADRLVAVCLAGDGTAARELAAATPAVLEEAIARSPAIVARAAQAGRIDAVRLALDLGFDVNAVDTASHGQTALHEAAMDDHVDIARLLVSRGADLTVRDRSFDGTPLDWAEHLGQAAAAEVLGGG